MNNTSIQLKLAWLAGIMDGEGTLGIHKHARKNGNKSVYAVAFSVGNTDKKMIDQVSSILKCVGVQACPSVYQIKLKSWKPMYFIQIGKRSEIVKILDKLLPFLVTKKERASLVLEWCKSRLTCRQYLPGTHTLAWTSRDRYIFQRMKKLNTRGAVKEKQNA